VKPVARLVLGLVLLVVAVVGWRIALRHVLGDPFPIYWVFALVGCGLAVPVAAGLLASGERALRPRR
jgi:hypothetical protein